RSSDLLWQPIFSRSDKHLGTLISIRETEVDRDHAYLLELRKTASRVMHHSAEITHEFDKVCALVTSSAASALRVRRAGVWMFDRDMKIGRAACRDGGRVGGVRW